MWFWKYFEDHFEIAIRYWRLLRNPRNINFRVDSNFEHSDRSVSIALSSLLLGTDSRDLRDWFEGLYIALVIPYYHSINLAMIKPHYSLIFSLYHQLSMRNINKNLWKRPKHLQTIHFIAKHQIVKVFVSLLTTSIHTNVQYARD